MDKREFSVVDLYLILLIIGLIVSLILPETGFENLLAP